MRMIGGDLPLPSKSQLRNNMYASSMAMPAADSNFFASFQQQFNGSANNGLLAPFSSTIGNNRGSGTGSPSSLDAAAVAPTSECNNSSSNNMNNSAEDPSKSFPLILYNIVSDPASDHCIHWLPCGKRFVIADKDDFSTHILPRYFGGRGGNTTKFTSFTRRLKRWNFSRVPSGREMGAYYHENFQRGEPEMARKIIYPVNKSQAAGGGKGKADSRPTKGGSRKGSPVTSTVSKARRRASTGSILYTGGPPTMRQALDPTAIDSAFDFADISPTPIRGPITTVEPGSILPPPMLENDMKAWLSSADFLEETGDDNIGSSTPPSDQLEESAPSVVSSSSSFLHSPPTFAANVISAGSNQGGMGAPGSMMKPMFLKPMRRHSTTLENLTCMPAMTNTGSNSQFQPSSQLLGTNFSGVPEAALSAAAPDTALSQAQNTALQPGQKGSSNGGSDNFKDPFSFSREFSFDDLKTIDPFT